jgi:hypothetical protein
MGNLFDRSSKPTARAAIAAALIAGFPPAPKPATRWNPPRQSGIDKRKAKRKAQKLARRNNRG